MATATPAQNARFRDGWQLTDAGVGEVRHFVVDAVDPDTVLAAAGLPRRGEAFSVDRPDLRVSRIFPVEQGVGEGAWSMVRVEWDPVASPGPGRVVRGYAGLIYTERQLAVETAESVRILDENNTPTDGRLREPYTRPVAASTMVVRQYHAPGIIAPTTAALESNFHDTLNAHPVRLPRVGLRNDDNWVLDTGQGLYLYGKSSVEDGLVLVEHTIVVKFSWEAIQRIPNADGNYDGVPEERYRAVRHASWAGLWPGIEP